MVPICMMSNHSENTVATVPPKIEKNQAREEFGQIFDIWLQRKYLPPSFQCNEQEVKLETRNRCFRKIRFDLKELLRLYSILILLIWILSAIIFTFDYLDDCSLFESHHQVQPTNTSQLSSTKANRTWSSSPLGPDLDSTSSSIRSSSTKSLRSVIKKWKRLGQSQASNESHVSNCEIVSTFVIADFALSTIGILYLLFYLFHIVETATEFPWFVVEISFASVFMALVFGFAVALCIVALEELMVILGLLQCVCAGLFVLTRYDQCKLGRPPQDPSDAVTGNDYFRDLKNIFHSVSSADPKKLAFQAKQASANELESKGGQ